MSAWRSTAIYLPSILMPRVAAMATLLAAAHLMPVAELGLFTLVIVVGELIEMSSSGWVRVALIRQASHTSRLTTGSARAAALLVSGAVVVGLVGAVGAAFMLAPDRVVPFAVSVITYVVANSVNRYALTLLQMQHRTIAYSIIESARALCGFVAIFPAMILTHEFCTPSVVSSLITLLSGLIVFIISKDGLDHGAASFTIVRFVKANIGLVVITALGYGVTSMDRVLLKLSVDASAVGIYSAAYAVARQGIDVMANAVNTGGFPRFIAAGRLSMEDARRSLEEQSKIMLYLLIPAASILMALRVPLLEVLLPHSFVLQAARCVPFIVVGSVLLAFKNFTFDNVFHLTLKSGLQAIPLLLGAGITLLVGLLAIPTWGSVGAATAFLAGCVVSLAGSSMLSAPLLGFRLPFRDVAGSLFTGVSAFFGATAVCSIVPGAPVYRVLAGAFAGAAPVLWIIRKQLKRATSASQAAPKWMRLFGSAL